MQQRGLSSYIWGFEILLNYGKHLHYIVISLRGDLGLQNGKHLHHIIISLRGDLGLQNGKHLHYIIISLRRFGPTKW
jgi:urease beta subunit